MIDYTVSVEEKETKTVPVFLATHFLKSKTTRTGSSSAAMRKAVHVACFLSGWKDSVFWC